MVTTDQHSLLVDMRHSLIAQCCVAISEVDYDLARWEAELHEPAEARP